MKIRSSPGNETEQVRRHPHPALIVGWLTPVYDLFARHMIPETELKRDLIAHAHLAPGHRLLDLGAGTGTLAIMIKQMVSQVQVTGLDSDPDILATARRKAARAGAQITLDLGTVTALPYPDKSFDRVVSSLVFSLLNVEDKRRAIREAYRTLRSGGELHIADFGPPQTRWARWAAPWVRRFEPIAGNLDGLLPDMFREAGFDNVEAAPRMASPFGTLWITSGRKPA